jgi:hypothetical protein
MNINDIRYGEPAKVAKLLAHTNTDELPKEFLIAALINCLDRIDNLERSAKRNAMALNSVDQFVKIGAS